MPLKVGSSDKTFRYNVGTEMNSGRPQKQALAIAYAKQKEGQRRRKMWVGGMVEPEAYEDEEKKYHYSDFQEPSHLNHEEEDFSEGGLVDGYADGGMVEHGAEDGEHPYGEQYEHHMEDHPYGREPEMDDEEEIGRDKRRSLSQALMHLRRFR